VDVLIYACLVVDAVMALDCDVSASSEEALNLLTDCDYLCHVIYTLYMERSSQEKVAGE